MNEIIARIGRRKLGKDANWHVVAGEHFPDGRTEYQLCPRLDFTDSDGKPQTTWAEEKFRVAFCVVESERLQEQITYESDTGNCAQCLGKGKHCVAWNHITGNKYRTCKACGGTGKAGGESEARP